MNLEEKILAFLQHNANSDARKIVKYVGATKTEINSVLYRLKGEKVRKIEGSPPKWSLLDLSEFKNEKSGRIQSLGNLEEPIHIDFNGGDWLVTIRIAEKSINDPIFTVERIGERKRVVLISSELVKSENLSEGKIPPIVASIASAALVWEYMQEMDMLKVDHFDFAHAMKDVILSLAVH